MNAAIGHYLLSIMPVYCGVPMCMTHLISGVSERLKYLYNNSFYIQQTVIIIIYSIVCMWFCVSGENRLYALVLWQISVHSVSINTLLRHHRNDYVFVFIFSLFVFFVVCNSFMQNSSAEVRRKYWNNISMNTLGFCIASGSQHLTLSWVTGMR